MPARETSKVTSTREAGTRELSSEEPCGKTVATLGWAHPCVAHPTVSAIRHPFSELPLLFLFVIFFLPTPCPSIFLIEVTCLPTLSA